MDRALTDHDEADEPDRGDAFPSTRRTYLGRLLDGGDDGIAEARSHLMEVYAPALRIYLVRSSFRELGDPEELVNGFFADRLGRGGFLQQWRQSRRRLRYWLIRSFKYYLMEHRRAEARAQRPRRESRQVAEAMTSPTPPQDPERAFHRVAAMNLVRKAIQIAAEECRDAGLSEHWSVFVRHHLNGEEYAAIADDLSVTPVRAAVMARTASQRFRAVLRQMTAWPGADREDLDVELAGLIEVIRR